MADDESTEAELRRWFQSLDLRHPAIRVLWKIALERKRRSNRAT
jgi:hypothetical protein